jgi:hypothetical protein
VYWTLVVGSFIHARYGREMNVEEDEKMIELIKEKIPALELKFKEFLREKEKKGLDRFLTKISTKT